MSKLELLSAWIDLIKQRLNGEDDASNASKLFFLTYCLVNLYKLIL